MEITRNVKYSRVSEILSSINKSPESWSGWVCMHLDAPVMFVDDYEAFDEEIGLELFLKASKIQGYAYITINKDILILCKETEESEMALFASELKSLYEKFALTEVSYEILTLPRQFSVVETYNANIKTRIQQQEISNSFGDNEVKSILVVDDDPMICKMVFNTFHDQYYIIVANDGEEALKGFCRYNPDIVLLDINMPKIQGEEVLQSIMQVSPETKVVMFSGNDDVENISSCINHGASGFIPKPFSKDRVQNCIKNLS